MSLLDQFLGWKAHQLAKDVEVRRRSFVLVVGKGVGKEHQRTNASCDAQACVVADLSAGSL